MLPAREYFIFIQGLYVNELSKNIHTICSSHSYMKFGHLHNFFLVPCYINTRSCSVNVDFKLGESMTGSEVGLEMAEFKYYDDPGLFAAWLGTKLQKLGGEDNSKTTFFKICLICLE